MEAYFAILEHIHVASGPCLAVLIVVDAFGLLALGESITDDAQLHGAHPGLADLGVARVYGL